MNVDLAALRALIEAEISKLEQEKNRLQKQLQHIQAVEQIAKEAESRLRIVDRTDGATSNDREVSEQSRQWFQQA